MKSRLFFILRLVFLLVWLVLALVLTWSYHSGRLPDAESIVQASDARKDAMNAKTLQTIDTATQTLNTLGTSDAAKITAASKIAAIGLARKKAFLAEGYAVHVGVAAADARLANDDSRDLLKAVPGLVMALESSDERLRLEAAFALAQLPLEGQYDYVLAIGKVLKREFARGNKAYLAQALGNIGMGVQPLSAAPELARLLLEEDVYVLSSAARAFAKIGPRAYRADAEARLVMLLNHSDAEVREAAAEALGSIGAYSTEALQGLRVALNDPSDWVQCTAAIALMDLGDEDAALTQHAARVFRLPPKTTLFIDDITWNRAVKERAAEHLHARGVMPDAVAADLATFVKESNDFFSNEKAIQTLARGNGYNAARADALVDTMLHSRMVHPESLDGLAAMGPQVAPHLEPLLTHSDPGLQRMAAEVLAKAGVTDRKAIQRLIKQSREGGAEMGVRGIRALGGIRGADAEATQALVERLQKDQNPNAKAEACKALARLGPGARGAVPELTKWSVHDDDRIRPFAVMALVKVAPGDPATLEALRAALADKKYSDFKYQQALKSAGPVGEALVPYLVEAYERDQDWWFREEVVKILAWLGHPSSLRFILDRGTEKLHHGKVMDIGMKTLIREIDRMRMHADADREDRKRCIYSLSVLGLLDAADLQSSLAAIEDVQLGARLDAQYRTYKKEREGPQPPTMSKQLAALYGKIPAPRNPGLVPLIEALHDPYVGARSKAIKSLGFQAKSGAVEVPDILAVAFRDPSDGIRTAAVQIFAEHGLAKAEHQAGLSELLNTVTKGNRSEYAAVALASLGEPGVDVLLEASESAEDTIRRAAAYGLIQAGTAAEKARPRLEELTRDPHVAVKRYAEIALQKLDEAQGGGGS